MLKLSKRYLYQGGTVAITEESVRGFMMDANQLGAKGLRGKKECYFN